MGRRLLAGIANYIPAAVLALAVLVVAHNLTFLIEYGPEYAERLGRTGDGSSWDSTVTFVLIAAALLASAAGLRLAFLLWRVRTSYPVTRVDLSGGAFVRILLPAWLRLFSVSIPLFVLQEDYERWSVGLSLPGISVLGEDGQGSPILVFALVSLAFAVVVALFQLGVRCLETIVSEARTRSWRRAPRRQMPGASDPEATPASAIGRNLAGRAPPARFPA